MRLEACKGKIRDADTKQTISAERVVEMFSERESLLIDMAAWVDALSVPGPTAAALLARFDQNQPKGGGYGE